ncbi:MAG TPA: hypothetical protein VLI05_02000 [Candidatus Saccharimonadia bacterium]|nr:hypothetical protein [Candidatus Saccharimonadia bacterium]
MSEQPHQGENEVARTPLGSAGQETKMWSDVARDQQRAEGAYSQGPSRTQVEAHKAALDRGEDTQDPRDTNVEKAREMADASDESRTRIAELNANREADLAQARAKIKQQNPELGPDQLEAKIRAHQGTRDVGHAAEVGYHERKADALEEAAGSAYDKNQASLLGRIKRMFGGN